MRLRLENGVTDTAPSAAGVRQLLATLSSDGNSFAILAVGDQDYIQTQVVDAGFILEKRAGGPQAHFEAAHSGLHRLQDTLRHIDAVMRAPLQASEEKLDDNRFYLEEVTEAFVAYLSGWPDPDFLQWNRIQV